MPMIRARRGAFGAGPACAEAGATSEPTATADMAANVFEIVPLSM
jgi:hypothetical protein